jgi:predicted RND superfamily exporter protein
VQHDGITMATCGIPTISHYLQKAIVGDFTRLTGVAMILVLVILMIGIRNPVHVLLSMITLGMGLLFTLTIMRLSDTPWNIINIAVVPLIIGIGIDNSVHFLHALKHHSFDREGIRLAIAETGHPILMTALTSIIGFGSLLFNAYRGIQGIGMLGSIGIFACMVAALLGLPLLIIVINEIFGKTDEADS